MKFSNESVLKAPFLTLFCASTLHALLLAVFAASADPSEEQLACQSLRNIANRLPEEGEQGGSPPSDTDFCSLLQQPQRHRHRQKTARLEPYSGQDDQSTSTFEETADNSASAVGNSFITLRSPVHKVAVPSESIEYSDSAESSGRLQHGVVRDSVGMRVVHLLKRTVASYTSMSLDTDMRRRCISTITNNPSGCFMAFAASVLLICVATILIKNWLLQVTLRSVRVKIQRANEFFLGLHSDQPLCLHCVEFMPSSSSGTVRFLCGHSFHVSCTNKCYKTGKFLPGSCPICPGQPNLSSAGAAKQTAESMQDLGAKESRESGGSSSDLARIFTLQSIRERHPGVLSKERFDQLVTQPTAVLQLEMQFASQAQRESNAPLLRQCLRSKLRYIFG